MISRVIALAGVLLLASGCALFQPIIKSDPVRLLKDMVIYEKAKVCRSERLDLVIYTRRPVENPEEEIWIEDIRIDMILRRETETITITRYHSIEVDPKTGKVIPRTFYDFADVQLLDENFDWRKKSPTTEELQEIFKDILSDREIYPYEREYLINLKRELQTEYNRVVEKCLYGFKY